MTKRKTTPYLKRGRKPYTLEQYVAGATQVGECLIYPAHGVARRVYVMRHGSLPSHIAVCHTCDNPKCILDAHHFAGTWGDNVRDSVKKGRHSCFRKGGVRFSGPHTQEARLKISQASTRMWGERRDRQPLDD